MKATIRWLGHARERPEVVLSFAIGCVCGLVLRLPFFPWKLSNDASTVVGASLGALIGAGAAAVIASGIANRSDHVAKATVANVIREPLSVLTQLLKDTQQRNPFYHEIAVQITALKDRASQAHQRLQILSASDRFISGMTGIAIVDAMLVMNSVQERLGPIGALIGFGMTSDSNSLYTMSLEDRTQFAAYIDKLERALSLLGHTGSDA